jgi:hypothetical protein
MNLSESPATAPLPAKSGDDVAARLSGVEHEGVVADIAGEPVGARPVVEGVVAGIAEEFVGEPVAGPARLPGPCSTSVSTFAVKVWSIVANTASVPWSAPAPPSRILLPLLP